MTRLEKFDECFKCTPVIMYCADTHEVIGEYKSQTEAKRCNKIISIHISNNKKIRIKMLPSGKKVYFKYK